MLTLTFAWFVLPNIISYTFPYRNSFISHTACHTTVSLIVRVPNINASLHEYVTDCCDAFLAVVPPILGRVTTRVGFRPTPGAKPELGIVWSTFVLVVGRYPNSGSSRSVVFRQGIEAFLVAVHLQRGAGDQSLPRVPAQSRGAVLAIGDQRVERVGRVVDRQVVCLPAYSHPQADPAERSLPVSRQLGFFTHIKRRAPRNVVRSAVGPKGRVVQKCWLIETKHIWKYQIIKAFDRIWRVQKFRTTSEHWALVLHSPQALLLERDANRWEETGDEAVSATI